MKTRLRIPWSPAALGVVLLLCGMPISAAAEEDFSALVKRLQQEKPEFAKRQEALLAERYDLADRPAPGVTMSRGKPVQDGVRVKRPKDMTWEKLAALSPEDIKAEMRKSLTVEKLVNKQITSRINVSDAEIKDLFEKNKASFNLPEGYHLQHIMVTPVPEQSIANVKKDDAKSPAEAQAKAEKRGIWSSAQQRTDMSQGTSQKKAG